MVSRLRLLAPRRKLPIIQGLCSLPRQIDTEALCTLLVPSG